MTITIKTHCGTPIFTDHAATTVREGLTAAVKAGADLSNAYLRNADLAGAYLSNAYLCGANLSRANLRCAYLSYASLTDADMRSTDLTGATLTEAILHNTDLTGADLRNADLAGAYLTAAKGADVAIARTRILPEGAIIGWKKCRDNVIVKLCIPEHVKRSHGFGRKCRAEFADVLEVIGAAKGVSLYNVFFEYHAGTRVTADTFDPDWQRECSGGIHFYITREEAEEHE